MKFGMFNVTKKKKKNPHKIKKKKKNIHLYRKKKKRKEK